jgi:hypothetical protein
MAIFVAQRGKFHGSASRACATALQFLTDGDILVLARCRPRGHSRAAILSIPILAYPLKPPNPSTALMKSVTEWRIVVLAIPERFHDDLRLLAPKGLQWPFHIVIRQHSQTLSRGKIGLA